MEFIFPSDVFLDILNTIPSALLIIDQDDDIIFVNARTLWQYDYRSMDLLGSSIKTLVPKWKRQQFAWEGESRDREGNAIPVEVRSKPIDIGGEPFQAIALLDLREQKYKEERLKNLIAEAKLLHQAAALVTENVSIEEGYRRMIGYICHAMHWPIGHVYVVSKDAPDILEPNGIWYLEDKIKYKPFVDYTHLTTFSKGVGVPGLIMQSLKPMCIPNIQTEPHFVRKDVCTKLGICSAFGLPIILNGKLIAVFEFFSHSTIQCDRELSLVMENLAKQMSRVVERQQRDLELRHALTAKSDFLSMMSHEIRTPINVISGMADLLAESSLGATETQYVETLKRSAKALLNLINDILDLSKLESGTIVIASVSFSVRKVVQDTIAQLNPAALQKGLSLLSRIEDEVPKVILGDPVHLHQILVNLVGNAIKFTNHGDISIVARKVGSTLPFVIRDSGIGIAADKLGSVFLPFTQGDSTTTRQYGGTGLGLTICKYLIELMGGSISIASELGVGTEAIFTLPLITPESLSTTQTKNGKTHLTKPMKILLAEDSEDNRLLMETYFAKTPITLDEAFDGEMAFEMFKKEKYDLLLLDIQMPKMDGYMTARAIRAWEKEHDLDHLPIIAITAFAQKEDAQKSYDAGCDVYLTKPIAKDDLFRVIANYA